jgi:asparagine synthase (glutamine-hydrolysing)
VKLRFLALAGDPDRRRHLERAAKLGFADGLTKAHDGHAISLWTLPGTPALASPRGDGVLVGLLFERAAARRATDLPADIHAPSSLVRDFWGAYALFIDLPDAHSVLRDPSGSVPVYFGSAGPLEIYASDSDLLLRVLPGPASPDLDFIRHWLSFPFLRARRTGIHGARELLPGFCRYFAKGEERFLQLWSPFDFASSGSAAPTFEEASGMLREQLLRTIPCLAPDGEDILLHLSGGLDSSIVAAALHHAGRPFRAVNFATRSSDGDERPYARMVAAACGVELAELIEEQAEIDLARSIAGPLRPPPNPLLQPVHRAAMLHFAATGPGVVLDGAGGDNVFAYLNSPVPALDAMRQEGLVAGIAALGDVAELHGCTFWTAARLAFRKRRRGYGEPWRRDWGFLTEGAALDQPDPHPWLAPPEGTLQGSLDHVRMILGIQHFLFDPWPGAPAVLHPLLSQPLMETCLGTPTWLWVRGGRDRAVARAAFAGMLPEQILQRRGKGRLEAMFLRGYRAIRPQLEPFLLDGALAAQGIIDREAVRRFLALEQPAEGGHIRMLEIVAAEQWLRSFG